MLREFGYDTVTDRRLFALHLAFPNEFPAQVRLPPGNFVCLLAWDARGVSVEVISTLVERLLIAGACYFVCWAPTASASTTSSTRSMPIQAPRSGPRMARSS